jgi:ribonuclease Z
MLDICLLGSGGTLPLPSRRLSAALMRVGGTQILIDCGEGTQVAIRERAWGLRNIDTILLTHMHADHVLGLPGLLLTMAFAEKGPGEPLTILGPEPLQEMLAGLLVVAPRLPYPVQIGLLSGGETWALPGHERVTIGCALLDHDIPCLAYSVAIARTPRFDVERARALGIPQSFWRALQDGQSVSVADRLVPPEEVRGPARRGLRVVYATDTSATPALVEFVRNGGAGTDLFLADAMYASEEDRPKRWESQHLTFAEAAAIARDGGARRLWLTHFGPALNQPEQYLDRATAIFPPTVVGRDGLTETLTFTGE